LAVEREHALARADLSFLSCSYSLFFAVKSPFLVFILTIISQRCDILRLACEVNYNCSEFYFSLNRHTETKTERERERERGRERERERERGRERGREGEREKGGLKFLVPRE